MATEDPLRIVEYEGVKYGVIKIEDLDAAEGGDGQGSGWFSRSGAGLNSWGASAGKNFKLVIQKRGRWMIRDMSFGKKGAWVARFDAPHGTTTFNHINVNPRIAKTAVDPHIPLPGGSATLGATQSVAKAAKYAQTGLILASVAIDAYSTGCSVKEDYQNGTTRNTAECVSGIAGTYGGGFAGGYGGAAIGSLIMPGIGTLIGGLVGSIAGGIGGGIGSSVAASTVFDKVGYDLAHYKCSRCAQCYSVKLFEKESTDCPRCGCSKVVECMQEDVANSEENKALIYCFKCTLVYSIDSQVDDTETKCGTCGETDLGICFEIIGEKEE